MKQIKNIQIKLTGPRVIYGNDPKYWNRQA